MPAQKELSLFFLILPILIAADFLGLKAGPFDLVLHRATECNDTGTGQLRFSIRTRKVSKTTIVDVDGTLKIQIDDNITVAISAAIMTNGIYKDNYFKEEFPKICTVATNMLPKFIQELGKVVHRAPKQPVCPIAAGNLTLRNFHLDLNVEGLPAFFYNKYKIEVGLKRKHKKIGCVVVFVEAVPKKNTKRSRKKPR